MTSRGPSRRVRAWTLAAASVTAAAYLGRDLTLSNAILLVSALGAGFFLASLVAERWD